MCKRAIFLFASLLVFVGGCGHKTEKLIINLKESPIKPVKEQEEVPWITIWIHGTQLLPSMMFHDFFHSPDGLLPAAEFGEQYHLHKIAKTIAEADPAQYPFETFYIFGWSGKLDFKERSKTAKTLYEAIKKVVQTYQKEHNGRSPKIRIITHSHGGNVALSMAKIKNDKDFVVDQLILLACPVQQKTARLVDDPFFKEVISLYSSSDLLQVIDPQGIYKHKKPRPLFSERRFESEKITQICIKLDDRVLKHIDFIRLNFVGLLPKIITEIQSKKSAASNHGNNQDPIHVLSVKTTA